MSVMFAPRLQEIVQQPDDALTAYSDFHPTEQVPRQLVNDLFVKNWSRIVVDPCIEGAVFEVRFVGAPDVRFPMAILRSTLAHGTSTCALESTKAASRRNSAVIVP
jgi:hypothetical protein